MSVNLYSRCLISHINGLKPHLQACSMRLFAFCFEIFPPNSSICACGVTRPQMEEWGKISKQNANKRIEQACRWGCKPFICEMRHREYKLTLIDKGLNYFISVKLLIVETIVSQRP